MAAYRELMMQDPMMIQDPGRNEDLRPQAENLGPRIFDGQLLKLDFIRTQDAGIFVNICRQVCNFNLKLVIIIFMDLNTEFKKFSYRVSKCRLFCINHD